MKHERIATLKVRRGEIMARFEEENCHYEEKVCKDCAMRYATGETAHQGAKLHMALMKARALRETIKEFMRQPMLF